MIGLGFLLALIVYILIAVTLAVWAPRAIFNTSRARTIAAIVVVSTFVLIPTWDIIPGKLYFDHLCATEGGLKIYKAVEGVEGFFYETGTSPGREFLDKYGYKFLEGTAGGDSVYRYSLDNGKVIRVAISKPVSRYATRSERHTGRWNTVRHEKIVEDRETKAVLAVRTQFEYLGNWLQRKVNPLLGGGGFCMLPMGTEIDLYLKTLKPLK